MAMPAGAAKARMFDGILSEDGFAKGFFEAESAAAGDVLKRVDEQRCMRDDDDLRVLASLGNEAGQRRQQIGVKTGLRLVEDHEARRPRRKQGGGPE